MKEMSRRMKLFAKSKISKARLTGRKYLG